MNAQFPISEVIKKQLALVEVALELKYGRLDPLLTQENGEAKDEIVEMEEMITRLKEQIKELAVLMDKNKDLLSQVLESVGGDLSGLCPDPDSRLDELLGLLASPGIEIDDWRRVSGSYTPADKAAFAERVVNKIQGNDVYRLRVKNLQSGSGA